MNDTNSLRYYLAQNIPQEILEYDSKLNQLSVGKAGKLGAIDLLLERNPDSNKTTIKKQFSKVPLYTQRALYLEETMPSMAYLYIISPSGGVLQGDRYRIDISLRNRAYSHITTQGATRIYKMENNYATQTVNLDIGKNCYFEYVPDQIIPYEKSRFYQNVNIKIDDDATLIYCETIVPGRIARNEFFEYDICYLKTTGRSASDNTLKFVDNVKLEPKKYDLRKFGLLENHNMYSTVYILTKYKYVEILSKQINDFLSNSTNVIGGATILANDSGLAIRLLGNQFDRIKEIIFKVLDICRKNILNARFSGIRKN
ncbi:MAG: urease accessory protein UreD [Nitrososphaeraceae archaeon]